MILGDNIYVSKNSPNFNHFAIHILISRRATPTILRRKLRLLITAVLCLAAKFTKWLLIISFINILCLPNLLLNRSTFGPIFDFIIHWSQFLSSCIFASGFLTYPGSLVDCSLQIQIRDSNWLRLIIVNYLSILVNIEVSIVDCPIFHKVGWQVVIPLRCCLIVFR